ncbi:MAG: Trk family potassium uptake protein [Clostridia bacterium]|nr:Trk family potassium uptake protein [Clostridia bacterium]
MKKRIKLTYTKVITIGFALLILLGAFLLMLPVSSKTGEWTPFTNALFTSTSATCVTGLIVYDTFSHWSLFGQLTIITLIQIGGLGFMTIITMFSFLLKRRIGLRERRLLMESSGSLELKGVIRMIRKILYGTFLTEAVGAVLLSIRFVPKMGLLRGIYNAVFHSVSAFCNAGFDLMGRYEPFSSLTLFYDDILVNLTICALVIIGGVGFIVWNDIFTLRQKLSKYSLHSKIVLVTTVSLLLIGTVLFYLFERQGVLADMPEYKRWIVSFFQSVTPRTAGFNTADLSAISPSTVVIFCILMFIGGSPGSTAGGVKTTTFAVLVLSTFTSARRSSYITVFKKRLEEKTARQASAVVVTYVLVLAVAIMIMCAVEPFSMTSVVFEAVSAMGTVGVTMGITPELSALSKYIIMLLMYAGRIGGLTLMLTLAEKRKQVAVKRPAEQVLIG